MDVRPCRYGKAIREKKPFGVRVPTGRGAWRENADILLPVEIRDHMDRVVQRDVWELLGSSVE
jgi:hypothetical protein